MKQHLNQCLLQRFKMFLTVFLGAILLTVQSFAQSSGQKKEGNRGLKDYFKNYFAVGVAVGPQSFKGEEKNLILKEFNSVTPENAMKMGPIHPEENRYFWDHADAIVNFAQANGLRVRGHNLCWHEQFPKWIFTDSKGDTVTKGVFERSYYYSCNKI